MTPSLTVQTEYVAQLTRREYQIYEALREAMPGHASFAKLSEAIEYEGIEPRLVAVHIKRLRQKIGPDAIVSASGHGYRLKRVVAVAHKEHGARDADAFTAVSERLAAAERLLGMAHQRLDDFNARGIDDAPACLWCKADSYGGDGIEHADDCIVVALRDFLNNGPDRTPAGC